MGKLVIAMYRLRPIQLYIVAVTSLLLLFALAVTFSSFYVHV